MIAIPRSRIAVGAAATVLVLVHASQLLAGELPLVPLVAQSGWLKTTVGWVLVLLLLLLALLLMLRPSGREWQYTEEEQIAIRNREAEKKAAQSPQGPRGH